MMGQLTFLGTGASLGTPVLGCPCEVCSSKNPHNQRTRASVLLKTQDKDFLIDAGPDLRLQALRESLPKLDGVLFTHAHQDHTGGIDDLRPYYFKKQASLPCLVSEATAHDIGVRFGYMLQVLPYEPWGCPRLVFQKLPKKQEGEVEFEGLKLKYFTYDQTGMPVNGFRFGNLAYVTDIKEYSPSIFKQLEGVEVLILSALRFTPSPMHFTVDEAVAFIEKTGAKQSYLTHIAHDLDHEKTNAYLPNSIQLAYDGLKLTFNL